MVVSVKVSVLLLKNPSEPSDRYKELISQDEGSVPIFVPVLEHSLLDHGVNEIAKMLREGGFNPLSKSRKYGGIIFTSQRAVTAFAVAIELVNAQSEGGKSSVLDCTSTFYVVGQATYTALAALQLPCPIKGQDTGNGEALAAFILNEYQEGLAKLDLLFMVGETRRDIIPKTLQSESLPKEQRIRVNEIEVYKSIENSDFPRLFKEVVSRTEAGLRWVVVFSPTGCKSMFEILGLLAEDTGKYNGSISDSTKIATIGPTTRDYLQREFGFSSHACAAKPTPEALLKAIKNAKS
jgi:uroporphyrinogen-III synthase